MFHVVHVHDLDKCKYVVNNGSVLSLTSSVVTYLYKKKRNKSKWWPRSGQSLACVAAVSVSFKPSGAEQERCARASGKKEQKSGSGEEGRGREEKEMPAAEPRNFTERLKWLRSLWAYTVTSNVT